MYTFLLPLHSAFRWFVLLVLIIAIVNAYRGWKGQKAFSKLDNSVRYITATAVHIQFLMGIWLYIISPVVHHFWNNPSQTIHEREIRFFGIEHITVMLIAVIVITIGSAKVKQKLTDAEKFKTVLVWFTIGLFLILTSIPWEFSPLISRPHFRAL